VSAEIARLYNDEQILSTTSCNRSYSHGFSVARLVFGNGKEFGKSLIAALLNDQRTISHQIWLGPFAPLDNNGKIFFQKYALGRLFLVFSGKKNRKFSCEYHFIDCRLSNNHIHHVATIAQKRASHAGTRANIGVVEKVQRKVIQLVCSRVD